ncbi:MoxR family ATPase [Myxococcota bacterium]|nr:MoxR family ATPase [Myxococcota bacterium]
MTPAQLQKSLERLIEAEIRLSVMIWGPPGVGKSSIVAQTAARFGLRFIDLRLSQLAPTDLRGLPVPKDGISAWYPPEFLPREGHGVLFMDELNMAPPTLQGIAQQLILDRRVGAYQLPEGWFIWAAGNRKEDRAAVFEMPSPLANRFIHFEVQPHLEGFRDYAIQAGLDEQIVAFLSYRPELLHKPTAHQPAWPSPRAWEMASKLHRAGMAIEAAVGQGPGEEFEAFIALYRELIDVDRILDGGGEGVSFPRKPSMRYALAVALGMRADTLPRAFAALRWMHAEAEAEWLTLMFNHLMPTLQREGLIGGLIGALAQAPQLHEALREALTAMHT